MIPKIIHKGSNTFEFIKKVKDNMYLYQEKNCGFKTTFSDFDLGNVQEEVKPDAEKKIYIRAM